MAKTVLLIEDNEDNRIIYETILRHYGYEVVTAADGLEGLDTALHHQPDLILLDISLPQMSGWEIVGHLQADERTRHAVIIALTAHVYVEDRIRAHELGFHSYLAKPVEPRRVVEEVERFIGPAGPPPAGPRPLRDA